MCCQELKGKFLIKGKRLNKLEVIFTQDAADEETDVTEEEESNDEDEDVQKGKVAGASRTIQSVPANRPLPSVGVSFARAFNFLLTCRRRRS